MALVTIFSCSNPTSKTMPQIQTHVLRLKPGADLKQSIQAYVDEKQLKAGWVVTCAGSLTNYQLRFANQQEIATGAGHFEILSLSGTVSSNGSHLHLAIADSTGKCMGGHLVAGCTIYTTAEIVLQESDSLVFTREKDGTTPWEELQIGTR